MKNKTKLKITDWRTLIKRGQPSRAAAAAILASAFSAFVVGDIPGNSDVLTMLSIMLLCAVFTGVTELFALPYGVLLGGTAAFLCAGGALFFLPIREISIYSALASGAEVTTAELLPIALLLCGAMCLVLCVLGRSFVARCIIAGGLAVMLVVMSWFKITLLIVPAILITAYILIVLCQVCAARVSSSESRHSEWFIAFSLLVAVLAFVLPAPKTRIPWERLFVIRPNEQMQQLGEVLEIEKLAGGKDNAESGYSEDQTSLGGWLTVSSDMKLVVEFFDDDHGDRLTGSMYDRYTGKGWYSTAEVSGTGYGEVTEPSATDVMYVSGSDVYGRAHIAHVNVPSPSDLQQRTLFYPPYSYYLVSSETGLPALRDGVHLTFEPWSVRSYTAFFEKQPEGCELTYGERLRYLSLPAELPERVRTLAAEATAACEDDRSKADGLMKLMSGYVYDLKVTGLPNGRDFVDYFLFDQKKGYCEYFASAMAVMARSVGIPSRYVQGYALDTVQGNVVRVTGRNAHAWAELYIDGQWVVYDPAATAIAALATEEQNTAVGEQAEAASPALKRTILYSYAVTAAAVLLILALRPYIVRWIRQRRIRRKYKGSGGYPVIVRCTKLLWVLSSCGVKRGEAETLTEFGARVAEECPWLDAVTAQRLSQLLEQTGKALYSSGNGAKYARGDLPRRVRRAYVRKHGLISYLRGHRRATL